MKNPLGKTVKQDKPYLIYVAPGFEWRVLKAYQLREKEEQNPYARWFMATKGPGTFGSYELGDGYVKDVKQYGTLTYSSPEAIAAGYPEVK